jgi:hypothetical protein
MVYQKAAIWMRSVTRKKTETKGCWIKITVFVLVNALLIKTLVPWIMECGFQMTEISFYNIFSLVVQNMI